ncbi:hypothetical protein BS17DRAFT_502312 [Gyrodon lividus]|nr:hypothetical protein BS17DRAFT_502312 [Gyrodon lividus]
MKSRNVIVTQLARQTSHFSVYFAAPFALFLWTNYGASRQTIEALSRCGLCVSFPSPFKLLKNMASQSVARALQVGIKRQRIFPLPVPAIIMVSRPFRIAVEAEKRVERLSSKLESRRLSMLAECRSCPGLKSLRDSRRAIGRGLFHKRHGQGYSREDRGLIERQQAGAWREY